MAERILLAVFAYDISSDRIRGRVARILEELAVRVQDSVFEAPMTRRRAGALTARLEPLLDEGDSLRVYLMPRKPEVMIRAGSGSVVETGEFYLL
jgi:CRISPR-associated protein Cas2